MLLFLARCAMAVIPVREKFFHAPEGKACPIYDCVRNNKCMQNCENVGIPVSYGLIPESQSFLMKNLKEKYSNEGTNIEKGIEVVMSKNKEIADYIMDQLSDLGNVRNIPMMGGYIFYYKERIFGGIYGNGFLVKITETSKKFMPDSEPEPPYEGAKPMLPVTILEDRTSLQNMVEEMYPELPERKPKKKKA